MKLAKVMDNKESLAVSIVIYLSSFKSMSVLFIAHDGMNGWKEILIAYDQVIFIIIFRRFGQHFADLHPLLFGIVESEFFAGLQNSTKLNILTPDVTLHIWVEVKSFCNQKTWKKTDRPGPPNCALAQGLFNQLVCLCSRPEKASPDSHWPGSRGPNLKKPFSEESIHKAWICILFI